MPTHKPPKYDEEEITGVEVGKTITVSGHYPATGALIQIGKASLPALIEVIATEEPATVKATNALYTLEQIYRDDLLGAAEYVSNAMTLTEDAAKKLKLQKAQIKILNDIETLRKLELKTKPSIGFGGG